MAKLNIEFKENGSMEFKLDFLGHIYTQKITRVEDGALFYDDKLATQAEKEIGEFLLDVLGTEETAELLIEISEITDSNLADCIGDIVAALTEYEQQIKAEARP